MVFGALAKAYILLTNELLDLESDYWNSLRSKYKLLGLSKS